MHFDILKILAETKKKTKSYPFFRHTILYYVLIFNEKDIFHYKSATSGTNVIRFFFNFAKREKMFSFFLVYIRQLADTTAFLYTCRYKQIVTLYFIQHNGNKALMHDE